MTPDKVYSLRIFLVVNNFRKCLLVFLSCIISLNSKKGRNVDIIFLKDLFNIDLIVIASFIVSFSFSFVTTFIGFSFVCLRSLK